MNFVFIKFLFLIFFFLSDKCPYAFYKTQPYISLPIIAALKLKSKFLFNRFNSHIESRAFQTNDLARSSETDFTQNNTNEIPNELDHTIRFASLGLAVKNIFHDLIVRRILSFARLIQMTSFIWES